MMKKEYMKPYVEVEVYELDAAIAANCGQVISLGPEAPGKEICKEFEGAFDVISLGPEAPGKTTCDEFKDAFEVFGLRPYASTNSGGTPFYNDGSAHCDCYYSSGSGNYFTS